LAKDVVMATLKLTQAQVLLALRETKGTLYLAAKRLGCSVRTVQRYCQRFANLREAAADARGEMIDTSELKLWQAVQEGQPWAIRLVLQTLGADRGYGRQVEVKGIVNIEVEEIVVATRHEAQALLALIERERAAEIPQPTFGRRVDRLAQRTARLA
jgi:hypothetical protein